MRPLNRREFLRGSCVTLAAVAALPSRAVAAGSRANGAIRLGAPTFAKTTDPDELARAHRELGYRAAYCPKVALADGERVRAFAKAFASQDVVIAEVGRWVNLLDADAEKRRKNLATVIEGLALADEIGARCCVDIAGSYSRDSWFGPHPDNLTEMHFDASVENARKIIDAVKPRRAKFCFEMMGWSHPHSADGMVRMLQAVDRDAFGVHLDPCNLINSPERFYGNTALLNECFDKLGPRIVSCHAKDLTWDVEMNVHFREVAPGQGALDYGTYLRRLAQLPQMPPLMIEHLRTADDYAGATRHIVATAQKLGLSV